MKRLAVVVAGMVAALLAGARSNVALGDSLSSLPDPRYAEMHPPQAHALRPHIGQVVYPTLGLPALAPSGGTFDIWVSGARSRDLQSWKVALMTDTTLDEGPAIELRPVQVDSDGRAGVTKLRIQLPATIVRDVYDVRVFGPDGLVEMQPRALRVTGAPKSEFRFAMMSDHQLWDPSWKVGNNERNAGDFPMRGEKDRNRAAARQGWHELELLDPDFVLYGGDLIFGLDYPAEMEEAWQLWSRPRLATFMVPGNHDAYARYEVKLKGGTLAALGSLYKCKHLLAGELSWAHLAGYIGCAYGDVREHLFHNLLEDGLAYYQTTFGPPYYSFDAGNLHFIALNTYGGTPERRHSFSIYIDLFDTHLGAPAVDNYGGYMTDEELEWLEADAARAEAAGKTIVVYGHHDPRGNRDTTPERRYHADNPFPTDPISLEGFQEWNYDGAQWDSDPSDRRSDEKSGEHSGTRLLRVLARHASYVLLGHRHADEHTVYEPGDELAPGVRATRRMEWVRVTSAAGGPADGQYWGYRVFGVREGHIVDMKDFDPAHQLGSVPVGNFWADSGPGLPSVMSVVNELPRAQDLTLRFALPSSDKGWRFVDSASGLELPLRELAPLAGGKSLFYVRYQAPPGLGWPPTSMGATRRTVAALPADGNHAPEPRIAMTPDPPIAGQPVTLSAAGSTDADGDAILEYRWQLPSGTATGAEVTAVFPVAAAYAVALDVVDGHGARGHLERAIAVAAPPPPLVATADPQPIPRALQPAVVKRRGCGCELGARAPVESGPLALVLAASLAALALSRRRRPRATNA